MTDTLYRGITRIRIPFDGVTTAAFLLCADGDCVIYDSGASASDARQYILPEVEASGCRVTACLVSHSHGDHAGGAPFLCAHYGVPLYGGDAPECEVPVKRRITVRDGTRFLGRYRAVALAGHSPDMLGVFDEESRLLLTADAVQLYGVGRYGCFFSDGAAYLRTLEKLRALAPSRMVASHAYVPLGEEGADVAAYLDTARDAVRALAAFLTEAGLSGEAAEAAYRVRFPQLPPVSYICMKEARCAEKPK